MTTQPEQALENNLMIQPEQLGYKKVVIKEEQDLLTNLKSQLEKHNKIQLSSSDFKQILNFINKGNVFERERILRDRVPYTNDKGEHKTLELINQIHWCQNQFQVTQQVSMEGKYKNRYDVTILISGLPLVQIELKRRGLELKEAFKQTSRYELHSYSSGQGLFQFIQIFVISNGVNTKYYANSPLKARSFKQTFYWADTKNKLITQLSEFADIFLEPCHLSKMVTKYVVLNDSQKMLMVLRPYQFYATEAILERVKTTPKFGYILAHDRFRQDADFVQDRPNSDKSSAGLQSGFRGGSKRSGLPDPPRNLTASVKEASTAPTTQTRLSTSLPGTIN